MSLEQNVTLTECDFSRMSLAQNVTWAECHFNRMWLNRMWLEQNVTL